MRRSEPPRCAIPPEHGGLADLLESLYRRFHRPEYLGTDPLCQVLPYDDPPDRQVAGLVTACLAYGRVAQIQASVTRALAPLGLRPSVFLRDADDATIEHHYHNFVHRVTGPGDVAALLRGIRGVLRTRGSLGACFAAHMGPEDATVTPALALFVAEVKAHGGMGEACHLLPDPRRGSACKRLFLYLRWMVRHDAVDPGGFEGVSPRLLVMPVDTHVLRFCQEQGITTRRGADLATAFEITEVLRAIAPHDPCRYDFAITRAGMGAWGRLTAPGK